MVREPESVPEPRLSPALEALRELEPDDISPRQALETLYRLQALDQEQEHR
jgi:DNA mismatch repair protein MutS